MTALAFSPDGKYVVSTDGSYRDHRIHFYDTETGKYRYTISDYQSDVTSLAFSPDGEKLASAAHDGTIVLWDFTSYPIVSISPDSVTSLALGEELKFDLKITDGNNLSGYQATIEYDVESLEYVETKYGDYLSGGVPIQPKVNTSSGTVQLASLSLTGISSHGDGILATIQFKVNAIRTSNLGLRDVILSDNDGNKSYAWIEEAQLLKSSITEDGQTFTCSTSNATDVNRDCVVNIQDLVRVAAKFGRGGGRAEDVNKDGRVDILDLVLVAGALGNTSDAPAVYVGAQEMLSAYNIQEWVREARKVNLTDAAFQRGILMLEQLLTMVYPQETALLPNYPNPFNPETWISYQLAQPASVIISIYSADGYLVRTLSLGNRAAGHYQNRSRAAYWDGKNDVGESVSSGIYFYTLTAGEFSATRKMLIVK